MSAFFGSPNSFLGIDIGTSSLKIVELIQRKQRIELSTYAEAPIPNVLVDQQIKTDEALEQTGSIITKMIEQAGVSTDVAVAALPNSIVFSTVTTMPRIPDKEMDKAVRFAARDLVPADLDEMVLGWSRVGTEPHMPTDGKSEKKQAAKQSSATTGEPSPVFLTAAPQAIVERYLQLMKQLKLRLLALEVETFPLIRSLMSTPDATGLIVDIGDLNTTFHIIDTGTPRVSHTMDIGGKHITDAIAAALSISPVEAENQKAEYGLATESPSEQRTATEAVVKKQIEKAQDLINLYQQKENHTIKQAHLIGGGAKLKGLREYWGRATGVAVQLGNPWKGLSYPQALESRLQELGPTYGVAVGLALRGFSTIQ